jgi:hypothetical protein
MSRKPLVLSVVVAVAIGGLCVWLAVSGASPLRLSGSTGEPGSVGTGVAAEPGSDAKPFGQGGDGALTSKAEAAMRSAASAEKYLFIYFYNGQDEQTRTTKGKFDSIVRKLAERPKSISVDISDPSEKAVVAKLGADRAPMPLVLAVAPNGAVTAGLGAEFTEEQMTGAFVSPCTEQCLGALQQGRLVLLCVQGASTKLNDEAMKGVRSFAADPRFAGFTDIVTLDPRNQAEAGFLGNLQVDPKTSEAVTVLLAPPGTAVARFIGKTDSNEMAQTLQTAMSGATCAPGSSPGCCPKK